MNLSNIHIPGFSIAEPEWVTKLNLPKYYPETTYIPYRLYQRFRQVAIVVGFAAVFFHVYNFQEKYSITMIAMCAFIASIILQKMYENQIHQLVEYNRQNKERQETLD